MTTENPETPLDPDSEAEQDKIIATNKEKLRAVCVKVLAIVVIACLHGVVLKYLWRWFVMPATGVEHAVGLAEAIGLVITARFLTMAGRPEAPPVSFWEKVYTPIFILAMAYIVHLYV